MMFKVAILLAVVAFAHGGVIAPVVPVVHPVHPVVTHTHTAVVHPAPVVHAVHPVHAPVVHAPLIHAPVPIVKHAPLIAVHH